MFFYSRLLKNTYRSYVLRDNSNSILQLYHRKHYLNLYPPISSALQCLPHEPATREPHHKIDFLHLPLLNSPKVHVSHTPDLLLIYSNSLPATVPVAVHVRPPNLPISEMLERFLLQSVGEESVVVFANSRT